MVVIWGSHSQNRSLYKYCAWHRFVLFLEICFFSIICIILFVPAKLQLLSLTLFFVLGSNNVPFFADYPYVTYKDRRPGSITKDEVFYIKYILKPQPLSTGQYVVTFTPGNNFRVWFICTYTLLRNKRFTHNSVVKRNLLGILLFVFQKCCKFWRISGDNLV